jgi:hypothetical protein
MKITFESNDYPDYSVILFVPTKAEREQGKGLTAKIERDSTGLCGKLTEPETGLACLPKIFEAKNL